MITNIELKRPLYVSIKVENGTRLFYGFFGDFKEKNGQKLYVFYSYEDVFETWGNNNRRFFFLEEDILDYGYSERFKELSE